MPLEQLHIVEKIKFLVANSIGTKKQILDEVKEDAREHRLINQRQEREDDARVDHAREELKEENKMVSDAYRHISNMLAVSVFINLIFVVAFILVWYFIFYG